MKEINQKEELKSCQCGKIPRLCYTGRKWKVTCDTEDCPTRDSYGKTSIEACNKWNGKEVK